MRAPLSWLREYVDTDATPAEIARRLTVSSLEVERVIPAGVSDAEGNLGHFVVGRARIGGQDPGQRVGIVILGGRTRALIGPADPVASPW